ncbi:hypothetical protein D9757_006660 [Collybiopsis confluens]|uniref:Transcription factor domain-containing protein n=1 Tax=Collybiopsis confluens TaxID=2823264 RepID=A0A8H5MA05_9AGAR|nr:hypothetical protein D9757_006660 [Collybiopsis confluens]
MSGTENCKHQLEVLDSLTSRSNDSLSPERNAVEPNQYVPNANAQMLRRIAKDIDRLQERVDELESLGPSESSAVQLYQPYGPKSKQNQVPLEPRLDIRKRLIDLFLESVFELSFSFNPTRFRASALLPYPNGHYARPDTVLMSMVYVWGIHLSQDTSLKQLKEDHLAFALRELASPTQSESKSHPRQLLHTIQAEILVTRYLISTGKVTEGGVHISRAKAMSIAGGFLKIRSNQTFQSSPALSMGSLPLRGFVLDKLWTVVLDEAGTDNVCDKGLGGYLDTPWPQEFEVYEQGGDFVPEGYSFTTTNFTDGKPTLDRGDSTQAMLAKAAFCWERAADLAKDDPGEISLERYAKFLNTFIQRKRWIENFMMTLPNHVPNPTPAKMARLLQAHSVAHGAYIQLLRIMPAQGDTDAVARGQAVISSAQKIVKLINSPFLESIRRHINPIMGYVWTLAYTVIVETGCVTPETMNDMQHGITVIARFSETCAFMRNHLKQMQDVLARIDNEA